MLPMRSVYCPGCNRKVMNATTRGTTPVSCKCKNCNKLVIYHPDTSETTISNVPQRTQSSGKRFY